MRQDYLLPRQMLIGMTALILISSSLFVLGISLERAAEANEGADAHLETEEQHSDEGDEEHEEAAHEESEGHEAAETHEESLNEAAHDESILGINPENPVFITAAVLLWLILTAGLWLFGRPILIPLMLFAGANAALDIRELFSQINRGNTMIASLAALIALMHIALLILALRLFLQTRKGRKSLSTNE